MNHGEKYLAHTSVVRDASQEMMAPRSSSSSGDAPAPHRATHRYINARCSDAIARGYR